MNQHLPTILATIDVNAHRRSGLTDEQIAETMKVHIQFVRMIPLPKPNPQRQRSVQHMQLQVMAQQLVPAIQKGDRDAMLTMLKVQQREANLLGLDAPKEVITHNFDHDKELENLSTAELKRRALEAIEQRTFDVTPTLVRDETDSTPAQAATVPPQG